MLSNGKLPDNNQWLSYAKDRLAVMFSERNIRSVVFIAYAVIRSFHRERAKELEASLGIKVACIEDFAFPIQAIENAECILVSGGNTWLLNQQLHEQGLITPIQRAVMWLHLVLERPTICQYAMPL